MCVLCIKSVGYYPVSSIMQPVHVSTQPHSSERKNRKEENGGTQKEDSIEEDSSKFLFSLHDSLIFCQEHIQHAHFKGQTQLTAVSDFASVSPVKKSNLKSNEYFHRLAQLSPPLDVFPLEISATLHLSVLANSTVDMTQFVPA